MTDFCTKFLYKQNPCSPVHHVNHFPLTSYPVLPYASAKRRLIGRVQPVQVKTGSYKTVINTDKRGKACDSLLGDVQ